jgi:hypothetical protein
MNEYTACFETKDGISIQHFKANHPDHVWKRVRYMPGASFLTEGYLVKLAQGVYASKGKLTTYTYDD